jgi:hypothetical protein
VTSQREDEHERELGFAGLLAAGCTPAQAWESCRRSAQDPDVRAIIADLATTPEGRAALDWSRLEWAQHGLRPPWEDDPA